MVISQIIGGLGNQMFQYAAGLALAVQQGTTFKLDISSFERQHLHQGFELQRIFDCPITFADQADIRLVLSWQSSSFVRRLLARPTMSLFRKSSLILEPHFHYYPGISSSPENAYLSGYWQSEKYFINIANQIRKDFTFKLPMGLDNIQLVEKISSHNSVSLHIRRGDYLSNPNNLNVYATCSLEYYQSAVRKIVEQVTSPHFFIFSDDIHWAKDNFKISPPYTYVDINKAGESYNDMRLMSLCRHNIIANSSFSWWGAWLNSNPEKIVISPRAWFINNTDSRDLIPEGWASL